MKMKINKLKIYMGLLTISIFSHTACSKWLDVQPSTQTTEDKQFQSQQGYIDALIGMYQLMGGNSSYGKDLTFGAVDVLAQLYQNKAVQGVDSYGYLARYNYTDASVKSTIDAIWSTQYKIIAQANFILNDIDAQKALFTGKNFEIIKGEALAIRALLHFDLLRLYGPSALRSDESIKTIPYMKQFSVSAVNSGTFAEIIAQIMEDLKLAESLLAAMPEIDQIKDNVGNTSLEVFTMFRQNRLNYWAVKGLIARASLYAGNKAQAFDYAKQVIANDQFYFVNGNTNTTSATVANSNAIFSTEHLFSIYKADMKVVSDRYFKTESSNAESEDLFSTATNLNTYYETSLAGHAIDIRGLQASASRWNQFSASTVYTNKYFVGASVNNVNQKLVPVIKLAEMYYIAAESAPTISESLTYLNKVRTARLIPELIIDNINTTALLDNEIFKEYRKEFYAEGQLWFYYKRKNILTLQNTVGGTMDDTKYVFPKPINELEFGI